MTTRAELKRAYLRRPREAGVYVVRNTVDGRLLLGSSMNLQGPLNRHRFMLDLGAHPNPGLQADWNRLGPAAFEFTVVDTVRPQDELAGPTEDELWLLEQLWLEREAPLAPRGYNLHARIRE